MKTMQEGSIGSRLVEARGTQTQGDFAARIGVHRNSLSRYEAGENEPSAEVLQNIGELGFNMNWLLTGEGEPRLGEANQGMQTQREQVGARLAQLRGEESQSVFSKRLGVHRNSLSRYELGDAEVGADLLSVLFENGYNPTWVLTGEGAPRLGEATPPAFDGARIYAANLATLCTTKCSGIAAQISVLIEHLDRPSRTVLKHLITSMNLLNQAGKELEADAQANNQGTH